MNFLDKLLGGKRLAALKSAADFEGAIPKIEAQLRQAVEARDAVDAQREQALFGDDGDLAAIKRQCGELDDKIETLSAALTGSRKRAEQARETERQSHVEARMREAQQLRDQQRQLVIDFHHGATELASILAKLKDTGKLIADANAYAAAEGRPDLRVKGIFTALYEAVKGKYETFNIARGTHPAELVGGPAPIIDPSTSPDLRIPLYWPPVRFDRHVNAPPYSLAAEIE